MRAALRRPPPVTSSRRGTAGRAAMMARVVKALSVAIASAGASPSVAAAISAEKASRSSDLGGGAAKYGCASSRASRASSTRPAAAMAPSVS